MGRFGVLVAVLACWLLAGRAAADTPDALSVDLSSHLVAVTTGFAGARVLLFGEAEAQGDVVVVVRGPTQPEVLRRKARVFGLWLNRARAVVDDAPAYYRVAASAPLERIAPAAELDREQIGPERLKFRVSVKDDTATPEEYRAALLRLKEATGLYAASPGVVGFIGDRLFRTEIDLPANVPTGAYTVQTWLLRDGAVISSRTTPLMVSRSGLGAEIFDFAMRRAAIYGVLAIMLAAIAGGLGAALFRKG